METENKRFRDAMAAALGLAGDRAAMDPKTVRLRETLFNIVPELKELVEKVHPKAKELLGLAEQAPEWGQSTRAYWQGVATRTIDRVYDGVAKMLLGPDKGAKDCDAEMRADLQDAFVRWVERDRTGQRVYRYEQQDAALVEEFLQGFSARYVDPARRGAAVNLQQRGQRAAQLPQGGGGQMPRPAEPPKVDNLDEDAVHGRAWEVFQQLRGA
jgi:hypothetical protein